MRTRRGAAIALAGGLGVAAVLGTGIIFWKDLAAAWHLRKLRTYEGYFEQILDRPEGSAEDLAVRRWVKTAEGRQAVFTIFAEDAIGNVPDRLDPDTEQVVFVWMRDTNNISGAYRPRGMSGGAGWGAGIDKDIRRLRAIARYLPPLTGYEFSWTRHPRFQFRILDPIQGFQLLEIDFRKFFGHAPHEGQVACLIERLPESPGPLPK